MTAAVVLAAGLGTRFGGGKMVAELDGRPILQHVLDVAADAGLDPVVVVLGGDFEAVEAAIEWRNEIRVRNDDPARGISSSVRLGLRALGDQDCAVVLLGDQPRLNVRQLALLTTAERDAARPIVVPRYAGVPGNPVLLEREAWRLARVLTADRGMSQLFAQRPDLVRYVDLPGTNPDVDTPNDLAAVSRAGAPGRSGRTAAAGRNRP